jgi:hypothetical protein
MPSGDIFQWVRRAAADELSRGGNGPRRDSARPLLLSVAIALLVLAATAFGVARSSHGALEPPTSLDRLIAPPALMPPRTPFSDHRILVGEVFGFRFFGATSAPSRGFAEVRRDDAASAIEGRRSLMSTHLKVWV